jgi:hypothetical protein
MDEFTAEINKVGTKLNKISNKIEAVAVLLNKPFQNWTEEEKE